MFDNFKKFKTIFKNNDLLFGSIILIILLSFCYSYAFSIANNINFFPMNGDFQNYNILRRFEDGQFFARDFNSYLGIGTMLFIYPFYLLDGSNGLSSSIFASYFSTQIIFIISCLIFLKLFKIRFFIASIVVFLLYFLSIKINSEFIFPGNSIYALRMTLPYLTVLAYLFILPKNLVLTTKQKILFSIVSGISLLWSNDYSIPVYISSTALFILITFQTSSIKIKDLFLYIIVSFITFFCLLSILTAFSPLEWIKYNFIGVASDQYWYYLGEVILGISQLPLKVFITLEVMFALYLLLKKDKNRYLIAFVILSSIFSGYLTQIGGRLSDRYFIQAYLLLFLIPAGTILYFLQTNYVKIINILYYRITITFIVIVIAMFTISIIIIKDFYNSKSEFYFEPYYDAHLHLKYKDAVDIAFNLKEKSKHLTKEKRIFSEYSTLMDDIIGGFQPSGNDYIIHAMGGEKKANIFLLSKKLIRCL